MTSTKENKSKTGMVEGSETASSASCSIQVHNEKYLKLKSDLEILCSGESKLSEGINEIKKFIARLRKIQDSEERCDELMKLSKEIELMQDEILNFVCTHEDIKAEAPESEILAANEAADRIKKAGVAVYQKYSERALKTRAFIESQ